MKKVFYLVESNDFVFEDHEERSYLQQFVIFGVYLCQANSDCAVIVRVATANENEVARER